MARRPPPCERRTSGARRRPHRPCYHLTFLSAATGNTRGPARGSTRCTSPAERDPPPVSATKPSTANVTVYWRPGCGFCSMLRAGLRRADLAYEEVNIWDDPDAAAFVRSVADGNETVPTVTIGGVALVNPSSREVVALARPSDDGDGRPSWWERLRQR